MITMLHTGEQRGAVLSSLVGNTPLLRLANVARAEVGQGVELCAKAEWYNPGGSVKDRAALHMLNEGIQRGALTPEKIIIDATSGNTGIAYAMFGAVLGYRVQLAVPANATVERKRLLAAYGADVFYTDPLEGTDGAQEIVRRLVQQHPDRYFYPDQYNNPANWQAHYVSTALEILEQTHGRVTHFVAGLGTTGTFVGTARRLKETLPAVRCIGVQPDSPLHGLEGLKHLRTAHVPGIFDPSLVDEMIEVASEEAYEMARRVAREEGLLIGPSSAAALVAALRIAKGLTHGVVVTIFADHGTRYASELFRGTDHAAPYAYRFA
ncbi:MAG: cysteine synthase [Ignavibacteria bacterium]